jgi:tRNA (guanine-N7-)-methyltransferase
MASNTPGNEGTLIYRPKSIVEKLPLDELFGRKQPLHVELGAGDGSFLIAYAQAHPEINFLGVERLLGRLRKIDRKGQRAGLQNLRLMRMEALYLVQYLLAPESVTAFHIYFADPWPKRRHWKNRLITEKFTEILRAALVPEGQVFLRTDNREYFEQMIFSFRTNPRFTKFETPESLLAFTTDFERGFHSQGIPTLRAAYVKTEI